MVNFLELANDYLGNRDGQIEALEKKIDLRDDELRGIQREVRTSQRKQKYLAGIGIGLFLGIIVDKPIVYKNIMAVINAMVKEPSFFKNLFGALTQFFGS